MSQRWLNAFWALFIVLCWGCSEARRVGNAGESCTAANDCAQGLACVAQVCTSNLDGGTSTITSSIEGGPCNARRQCEPGLLCVENICTSASMGTQPGNNRYSGRGESCEAKNDCASELACVMGICRTRNIALGRTDKRCHRVECANKDDCCAAFKPDPRCDMYKANCESDAIFCNTYRSLCQCTQDCVDEACVASSQGCMSNAECTSQQTPFCVQSKCRQCDKDSSCTGSGLHCIEGVCVAACKLDENCPALHSCQNGACVESGCKSDRECAFMTKNPIGICQDGKCRVPCSNDSECAGDKMSDGFAVCEAGECVFVGCENNAECRALFGLANMPGNVKAICR